MPTFKTLSATAPLAAMAGAALADGHATHLCEEGASPSHNDIRNAGEIDRFERGLGDKLCALAKLECAGMKKDWDAIIPILVSGNYDVIIAGMSVTAEQNKVIDLTDACILSVTGY